MCRIRFLDTDSKKGLLFQHFKILENFFEIEKKGITNTKSQKNESEYRARQQTTLPTRAHATEECAQRCPVKQLFHANQDMTQNNCTTLNDISLIAVHVPQRLSVV